MKDPACLFYIDKWLIATKEMKADCRGWYLNLILHLYDKKSLPNDIEELANLADVRHSEFDKFKQVFEQVLKYKFKVNENNRLEHDFVNEIMQKRDSFINKRSNAGKISYFNKLIKSYTKDKKLIEYLINNINWEEIDLKNKQMFEQVFKHLSELYINEDVNEDINSNEDIKGSMGGKTIKYPTEQEFLDYAKTIKEFKFEDYEFSLKAKYNQWVNDKWMDGYGKKIKNWKSKLLNTYPHLKKIEPQQLRQKGVLIR